jgi:hypothetical protein
MSNIRQLLDEIHDDQHIANLVWKIETLQLCDDNWKFAEELIVVLCEENKPPQIIQQCLETARELALLTYPLVNFDGLLADIKLGDKQSLDKLLTYIAHGFSVKQYEKHKLQQKWLKGNNS